MDHRLHLLVPESLDTAVRRAARRQRISKGEWVRRAIARRLAEEGDRCDPTTRAALLKALTAELDRLLHQLAAGYPSRSTEIREH